MPGKKKWQRSAAAGSEADRLRRDVIAALLARLDRLGLSRSALGQRARLGSSYVHEMVTGRLDPTLRSISRLVAVMDTLEGVDERTIKIVRGLCETVRDAQEWVRGARERIKRGSHLPRQDGKQ